MTVVTVFRSRLRQGTEADYFELAGRMSALVRTMEGFIDEKFYLATDGERVTVVRFTDAALQRVWASHPEHRSAQQRGRDELYEWYDIWVGEETYARTFQVPPQGAVEAPGA